MQYEFTPAVNRSLFQAGRRLEALGTNELFGPALLLALAAESECRAALALQAQGVGLDEIRSRWPRLTSVPQVDVPEVFGAADPTAPAPTIPGADPVRQPAIRILLAAIANRLQGWPSPLTIATEHMLMGLLETDESVGSWLRERGLRADQLADEISRRYKGPIPPTTETIEPIDFDDGSAVIPVPPPAPYNRDAAEQPPGMVAATSTTRNPNRSDPTLHVRLFDATANRAREGLRVVEDYVRFVLDDAHLHGLLKRFRHDLTDMLRPMQWPDRLAARETQHDVGTSLTLPSESARIDADALVAANFARLQEALRSLEEFGKLLDPAIAETAKQLRYRAYTLHRAVLLTADACRRLHAARLYVLLDGRGSAEELQAVARQLAEAGADVIQLRDKTLNDRQLVERARALKQCLRGSGTLFIVNDRADVAALVAADGVHVGQEELTVKDARHLVGPRALVGVSTHSIEQAHQAVLDGANYIGVGPTFPSTTKAFETFPGLNFVAEVAAEIRLPAFAIGGITPENLPQVLAAGATRVAVSGSVTQAPDPAATTKKMTSMLRSANRRTKPSAD